MMCAETPTPSPGEGANLPALPTPPADPRGEAALAVHQPPSRQLSEWPRDELEHLAEEFGLDPTQYRSRQDLVAALHERRQVIASMDREAMLDVVRWGRRPVSYSAGNEQIAQEICRIRLMRFHGLSQRGLIVLGKLRGLDVTETDDIPTLVRKLKRGEGLFAKINRKRRAMLGQIVSNIVGETESAAGYSYVPPPQPGDGAAPPPRPEATRPASIKEEIEESGLFGGITNRIKKTADQYLNQKLDEIENRIDRKLDEIDRRLSEWRDKEVANRVRILKITLWASVIVGLCSLIYSYVSVYLKGAFH